MHGRYYTYKLMTWFVTTLGILRQVGAVPRPTRKWPDTIPRSWTKVVDRGVSTTAPSTPTTAIRASAQKKTSGTMTRKRLLGPALICGRYDCMKMLHDNRSWPIVGGTSTDKQVVLHYRLLHHDQRRFYSFWPWRGGSSEGTDDYVDDDGFTESPQVSSFLLGSAARKVDGNSSKKSTPSSSFSSLSSSSSYPVSVCTAQVSNNKWRESFAAVLNRGSI